TVVASVVEVEDVTEAWLAFSRSLLLDRVESKLVPVTVTAVPETPLPGEKLVIVGIPLPVVTVNDEELVTLPLGQVTEIDPVVAPVGTVTCNCVVLAAVTDAVVPLNLTVS